MSRFSLSLLVLSLAAGTAAAQAPACVPDTTTTIRRLQVGLTADPDLSPAAKELADVVANQIGSFVTAPSRPTMDKLRGPGEWSSEAVKMRSEGLLSVAQLVLQLDRGGHVHGAAMDPGTDSPEVDRAVLGAVAAADSAGAFPPAAAGSRDSVRRVRLWLLTAAAPPSTWATTLFPLAGHVPAEATPVKVVSMMAPSYPMSARIAGREGDVNVRFAIDQTGKVPEASIEILSTDDPAFVEPAKATIRSARFEPATQGGCPTTTYIRQRVRFRPPTARQ